MGVKSEMAKKTTATNRTDIPYTWKVSVGKTFAVSNQTVKVSPLKFTLYGK